MKLMDIYHQGWCDELDLKTERKFKTLKENKAYLMGRSDALIGDEIERNDYQSEEEILKRIHES